MYTINVTAKKRAIKGSQDPNSPLKNADPNKITANKNVKPKESVNNKNTIKIRRDTLCIVRICFIN